MNDKKFKISWLEKKVGKSGKEYVVMHLADEEGTETQNVSTFELSYQPGQEIEGQIIQNGNFLNWRPKLEAPGFAKKGNSTFMMEKKATQIAEAQGNKARQIAEAQDRSALMWAKTNASTILSLRKGFADLSNDEIFNEVMDLATKIYNGEPFVPFN